MIQSRLSHAKSARKVRPRRGTSETIPSFASHSIFFYHLDKTHSGFILSGVKSLGSRNPPTTCLVFAILVKPQLQLPPIHQCRDHAIRNNCESNGPPLGERTAQETKNSLVQGQEKRASRSQVCTTRPTRRLPVSPRQRPPSTTSTPTARTQCRSLCPLRPILPRLFLPLSRFPLRQPYPTRLSSSSCSTNLPTSDLSTYKPSSYPHTQTTFRRLRRFLLFRPLSISNSSRRRFLSSLSPFYRQNYLPFQTMPLILLPTELAVRKFLGREMEKFPTPITPSNNHRIPRTLKYALPDHPTNALVRLANYFALLPHFPTLSTPSSHLPNLISRNLFSSS
jgi:hypothetical protein